MDPLSLWFALAGGALTVPLLHEGAHASTALLLGARGVRVRFRAGRALAPRVEAEFRQVSRAREACFFASGPVVNLAVAAAALVVAGRLEAWSAPLVVVGALHALYGALNLWPFAEGTDGRALLRLARARRSGGQHPSHMQV